FGDYELSYHMLDVRSSAVSRILQDMGADPGSAVPVCMERSPELVIALLGILKAGCAYVPIDPSYPSHRINHILEDTGAKMLISDEACYSIALSTGKPVLNISRAESNQLPKAIIAASVSADSLAYIMYTSGSTGQPKGVMVTHANVVRLVRSPNYLSFNSEHILLATAAIAFDATIFEYWGILLNGGTLVFCNQHELLNTQLLGNAMRQYNVNLVWFTASWLHQLIDDDITIFGQIKTLVAGGDKLSAVHVQRLLKHYPQLEVINGYGPTENTTFSLCHKIPAAGIDSIDNIPIGKPISNSTAYILQDGKTLYPVGVPGEICVGGAGVARGYLNHEALTAEKFIADPFSGISGSRLYRTGDIGYWREDG
ncbi:amino acid adenylation domain-containing protein, partial [Chitinophaga sp. S165]|uniref:amino acid adenylation domain-containing protein n=1 Tax=Chitinophaga sp. S165 TaxID=2135462 RepID=UPI0011B54DB6